MIFKKQNKTKLYIQRIQKKKEVILSSTTVVNHSDKNIKWFLDSESAY